MEIKSYCIEVSLEQKQKHKSGFCIVCGGKFDVKRYRLKAEDSESGETVELAAEWAHLECLYKLLEKAECRYGGRD